jgi:hypothetical protein
MLEPAKKPKTFLELRWSGAGEARHDLNCARAGCPVLDTMKSEDLRQSVRSGHCVQAARSELIYSPETALQRKDFKVI